MSKPDPIRIVVLGDTAMGKTALIVKLISGRFIWNYDPTMGKFYLTSSSVSPVRNGTELRLLTHLACVSQVRVPY